MIIVQDEKQGSARQTLQLIGIAPCGCSTFNACGFPYIQHNKEGCPLAPYDTCSYCCHNIVVGEESEHDECREKLA
jgi:hypothetical protein